MNEGKKATGRPTLYNEEIENEICRRLADGQSLRRICTDPAMPGRTTVNEWLDRHVVFRTKCAKARAEGGDKLPDSMEDIEERVLKGELNPKAASVVLSSMQWRACKLFPKKYGNRVDLTSSDGSMTPIPAISHADLSTLSHEELELYERLADLREQRNKAGESSS